MTRLRPAFAAALLRRGFGTTGALLALAAGLGAEPTLALIGPFAEKGLEQIVAQEAVDAHNARSPTAKLKLELFNGGLSAESSLDAAKRALNDSDVVAVVLHGEAAASPEVLQALNAGGLGAVAASSWAQTRTAEAAALWLCPSQAELASITAQYARREAKAAQVAVLDNGSPTSVAAARVFAARFRAGGGKVPIEASFSGEPEALDATLKTLASHWPQMVFYAGEGGAAGTLIAAMKDEKPLKNADLIGLPTVFEPAFFDSARLKSMRTRGIFPCPDFGGQGGLLRVVGLTFPKTSPEYKAYMRAFRKPGRWTSMVFDGTALAARAVDLAGQPAAEGAPVPALSRDSVRQALLGIESYRGIRGLVKFSPSHEPADPRSMVYFAQSRVNKKEMLWLEKAYGPPFK